MAQASSPARSAPPAPGLTAADAAALQAFCRTQLAPYKVPRRWYFLDELPRTPLGKVQKFALEPMLKGAGQR